MNQRIGKLFICILAGSWAGVCSTGSMAAESVDAAHKVRVGDRLQFKAVIENPESLESLSRLVSKGSRIDLQIEVESPESETPTAGAKDGDPNAIARPKEEEVARVWEILPEVKVKRSEEKPSDPPELLVQAVPLKPGHLPLPRVLVKASDGKVIARTEAAELDVESAIPSDDPEASQPEGAEPPVGLPFPIWLVIALGVGASLILGAVLFGLVRVWRRWWIQRRAMKAALKSNRPGDELALEELKRLEESGFIERGEFKAYYFRLSEIMKAYIGFRFGFDALESTTQELIVSLKEKWESAQLDGALGVTEWSEKMNDLFLKLDRVKFSDYIPVSNSGTSQTLYQEPQELIEVSRDWILNTRRVLAEGRGSSDEVR